MKTTDLSDAHGEAVRVADPVFRDFGGVVEFDGPALCVRAPEDNTHVRAALEEPGEGRVLVVDGGGSTRCALLGGNLAALGADNGWAGIVVNGCVRDSEEIAACRIGVKALATHPRRSDKAGRGARDVDCAFAGLVVATGEHVFADEDGLLVATGPLTAPDGASGGGASGGGG